ncbi:unnamed protein product [Sordaria macrospora k-hell]|uniref:WGS project CABT00000000 data, contig 2.27 n=2 Tax=Sordaria macrospora TaxID=5147 RepID=F7W4F8_SORMK|nr:uncharacterized protein SMAC_07692 [Sordaria macrospora k-hell]CCC14911.1 unnamed protein product [Sordaria macrospora k-hell]
MSTSRFDFVQVLKTSNTPGASWRLPPPKGLAPGPVEESGTLEDNINSHLGESVGFDPDNRIKGQEQETSDVGDGKAIVKLSMRYEGMAAADDRWATGTGYLIAPDTFITAGHNVYHRSEDGNNGLGFGRLTNMRCSIGYHGKGSAPVQYRAATKVVTTSKYIIDGDGSRDIAFVQLNKPFGGDDLKLFKFHDVPFRDSAYLGVVGYPNHAHEQPGDQQSVQLVHVPGAVISTTRCFNGSANKSGSVIGGQYGNDYKALMAGLGSIDGAYVTDISEGIPGAVPKALYKSDLTDSVLVLSDTAFAESASIFDGLVEAVQKVGSAVVKVAPKVLGAAAPPVLVETVKSHALAESISDDISTPT